MQLNEAYDALERCCVCTAPLRMRVNVTFILFGLIGVASFLFGYKFGYEHLAPLSFVNLNHAPCHYPNQTFDESMHDTHKVKSFGYFEIKRKIVNDISESVVTRVFGDYYHPSLMSKAEYVITNMKSWESKEGINCREMYHTRTGSRINQPAKCVAVVTVQDGQHSPHYINHRIGYTAGTVNICTHYLTSL
jgi:hypothetical protein